MNNEPPQYYQTRHGFMFGPVHVRVVTFIPGRGVVLSVATDHGEIQIYASNSGRKLTANRVRKPTRRE